jgi:alpha-tubulin suppressor-like RCC1 family protein
MHSEHVITMDQKG